MYRRSQRTKTSTRLAWSVATFSTIALLLGCGSGGSEPSAAETTSEAEAGPTTNTTGEPVFAPPSESTVSATEESSPPPTEDPTTSGGPDTSPPGSGVAFSVRDKFTITADGPGTVVLRGMVEGGVLRPGDGLEILNGGPDTGTTILAIRTVAPRAEVESLAAGEDGELVVLGELGDFEFDSQLVRPTN